MDYQLVFANTGHVIPLESINHEVLQYFVHNLDRVKANQFANHDGFATTISDALGKLEHAVHTVTSWPHEIRPFELQDLYEGTYLDQVKLCRLHTLWARSQKREVDLHEMHSKYNTDLTARVRQLYSDDVDTVSLADIMGKLNLTGTFDSINHELHLIEMAFERVRFSTVDGRWIAFDNPFGPAVTSNDSPNLCLAFNHLGRPCYNKWTYNDCDFEDENSFDQLVATLEIRIKQCETIAYSPEYVSWCQQHGKIPSGLRISLGRIPDLLDHFGHYRSIIYQNTLQNNSFSIQL